MIHKKNGPHPNEKPKKKTPRGKGKSSANNSRSNPDVPYKPPVCVTKGGGRARRVKKCQGRLTELKEWKNKKVRPISVKKGEKRGP